jgi:hypothetical protein
LANLIATQVQLIDLLLILQQSLLPRPLKNLFELITVDNGAKELLFLSVLFEDLIIVRQLNAVNIFVALYLFLSGYKFI